MSKEAESTATETAEAEGHKEDIEIEENLEEDFETEEDLEEEGDFEEDLDDEEDLEEGSEEGDSEDEDEEGLGITKEAVAEATSDFNAIYKEGAAAAKELKEAFDDIKSAFNFGNLFK